MFGYVFTYKNNVTQKIVPGLCKVYAVAKVRRTGGSSIFCKISVYVVVRKSELV